MSRNIGVVILDIPKAESASDASRRLVQSLALVPEGRCIVALYETSQVWSASEPYESEICRGVLGEPESRQQVTFEFFANGVSRTYTHKAGQFEWAGNLHWIVFRRLGDRTYRRRDRLQPVEVRRSELPVAHNAFTRDVANNVWHLNAKSCRRTTIERLSCLLAWQDERALVVSKSGKRSRAITMMDLDNDLVGVAQRIPYEVDGVLGLVLF